MQNLNIKEWKLLQLQITQTRHHLSILNRKNVYVQDTEKWKQYSWNVHKKEGAYLQCMNNHYAKFEYKWMNTVGVKFTQTRHPPKHLEWKKMSQFNTCQKQENIY